MGIFLTVHKRDFYQHTVTTVLPPSYLVTGHQIRSLPSTYTAPQKKREGGGGGGGSRKENLQRKPSKKANLQLKLEELYENSNPFFFTV